MKPDVNPNDTRKRAIAAADALLHEKGYLGVSMEKVANLIGIKKASLYHHFPDGKDQLILEMADRMLEDHASGFQNAIQSANNARQRLEAIAGFVFAAQKPSERVLRDAMPFMPETHRQHIGERFHDKMFMVIAGVLEDGIQRGELRAHDTSFVAWSLLGLLSELSTVPSTDPPQTRAAHLLDLLFHGIGAQPKDV